MEYTDRSNLMLLILITAVDQCQASLLHTCRHKVLSVVTLQVILSVCNSQVVYRYCAHAQGRAVKHTVTVI